MIDPFDALAYLGIKVSTLIAGFSGGIVYYYLEGSKALEKSVVVHTIDTFVSGAIGSLMAVYVAPVALFWFRVPPTAIEVQTGGGFIVGMTGIYLARGLMRMAAGWAKKPHNHPLEK